jgi:hypothetical protein
MARKWQQNRNYEAEKEKRSSLKIVQNVLTIFFEKLALVQGPALLALCGRPAA